MSKTTKCDSRSKPACLFLCRFKSTLIIRTVINIFRIVNTVLLSRQHCAVLVSHILREMKRDSTEIVNLVITFFEENVEHQGELFHFVLYLDDF